MTKNYFTKEQALKIALNTNVPFSSDDTQHIFNTAQIREMMNLAVEAAIGAQGQAVAEVRCRDGEVFGYIGRQVIRDTLPLGTKLYTTPQQPQSVADALEGAAKIADEVLGVNNISQRIRALIKRNAEGV